MSDFAGKTIDVGYVHVIYMPGGSCVAQCPHPAHTGTSETHALQAWCVCSCGAEHDRRGTGESGYDWHRRHLQTVFEERA